MTEPNQPDSNPNARPNRSSQTDESLSKQPTEENLVEQIQELEHDESGPNETLRRHIELFSRYSPVFKSLGHTMLGAAVVPFVFAFVAFQLSPNYELTKLPGALVRSLWWICAPLYASLCLARGLRPGGIAEKHFRWSPILCNGFLKTLDMVIWVWLPFRFIYMALETFDGGAWNNSLGRFLFIIAMSAMTFGLWRTSQSIRRWIHEGDTQPQHRTVQHLLLWFLPLMPASLAAMSAFGFHFTSIEMSWRVLWTILLMITIGMLGGLISRLLLIAQFGIKLRQLSRNEEGQIDSSESIDISAISKQVNRLLRATALVAMLVVGWQIWANVLPVFSYLDDWHVYPTKTADGVESWISVGHLLIAAGLIFITFVLSNNLPGLLEITLLDRLPLDRGGRYAISFVVKYVVGIVGIMAACQIIGFSWAKVQFLAAALTVGLGFGLQEIFANVVSGIIILIERPIRVGDVVTVNNTTGTVTRMQLRATTVMDRDFRELIVPNKKFITEDVMNWTLSELMSRVTFKVGVAYGSNTQLVHDTLMKVARRHPLVNEMPAPDVVFVSFGDSTLDFELRVFIPNREVYPKVLHELNMAIDKAFAEKEISIAFPQQDIFIKNLSELPVSGPVNGPGSGRSPLAGGSDSSLQSLPPSGDAKTVATGKAQLRATRNEEGNEKEVLKTTFNKTSASDFDQDLESHHSDSLIESPTIESPTIESPTTESLEENPTDGRRRVIPFPLRNVQGGRQCVIHQDGLNRRVS